ncbi:MAG: tetratricopeptide repeat protein, partial [Bacteroidales bacterium]
MKLKKSFLLILFVFTCNQSLFSQIDTNLVNQYYEKAQAFEQSNQLDSALLFYERTSDLAFKFFDSNKTWSIKKTILCLNKISNIYINKSFFEKAESFVDSALVIERKFSLDNSSMSAETYQLKGKMYYGRSLYDKALENLEVSLDIKLKIFGENHPEVATTYNLIGNIYRIKVENEKALEFYLKSLKIRKEHLNENHKDLASSYNAIGLIYMGKAEYDKALEYYLKGLYIIRENYGEINKSAARIYMNIGSIYYNKAIYDTSLINYYRALEIQKEIYGNKHLEIAYNYNRIAEVFMAINNNNKALEYLQKSLDLYLEVVGENHTYVSYVYSCFGLVYFEKNEFDKSLEYFNKSLEIGKELLGDQNADVAINYLNIGNNYWRKAQFEKALEFQFKALHIFQKQLDNYAPIIANTYNNLGNIYSDLLDLEKAVEYYNKCIEIQVEVYGDQHPFIAGTYNNIGTIYYSKKQYNKALEYYFLSLQINKSYLKENNSTFASLYNNIGAPYFSLQEYEIALKFFNLGVLSSFNNYKADTINLFDVPAINDFNNYNYLLQGLQWKTACIMAISNKSSNRTFLIQKALKHLQTADTLIDKSRKNISTLSDKLALSEVTNKVYEDAITICLQLANVSDKKQAEEYKQLAFYFSEKNKSQVLLQALSGQEAQKFSGIPDSLLEKEHNLKIDINFYEQKLADELDSITERNFRDKLFIANRQYEELISNFEASYPEYFNLKYSTKNPGVNDLQKLLDAKTAIRSYFVGDSVIYIFTISNKKFNVKQVAKIDNLEDTIRYFRYGLTKFSERMTDTYRRTGDLLYQQLFPESIALDNKIENLIIIPDGALATIPFEALLTTNMATIAADDFKNYPFLINRYTVSYSYSANLFYRTFPKEKQKQPELTNINDWLALAPVFDDKSEQGVMLATRELQKQINNLQTDTLNVRGRLLTGDYITPLPGTESETQAIIKEYENRNLKAQALLHQ